MAQGLAAMMTGQPIVKKDKNPIIIMKKIARACGLHLALISACVIYIYVGAIIFQAIEEPHEISTRDDTERKYNELVEKFLEKAEMLKENIKNETILNSSLVSLVDEHTEQLFDLFDSPIALNYFDSLFYRNGQYNHLWTMDSSLLFTSTTMVPVGFGLITPLTPFGRLFLCIYALIGIPLALVTMSDIGKFFCDAVFRLLKENMTLFVVTLLLILFLYPVCGGIIIHNVSSMTLFESVYYCIITILTVGYGDIDPPIPILYLILFIVVGVTLVTITVDVVATQLIHNIHYMGRQVGKAKDVAAKMISMAQKINLNKGLGLGMAQLGAFARMGMMINVDEKGVPSSTLASPSIVENEEKRKERRSTAFDPDIDFDLIDRGTGTAFDNQGFGYFDDVEDACFY